MTAKQSFVFTDGQGCRTRSNPGRLHQGQPTQLPHPLCEPIEQPDRDLQTIYPKSVRIPGGLQGLAFTLRSKEA